MIEVLFQKKFLKELADLPAGVRKEVEHFVFDTLPNARSLSDSGSLKKCTDTRIVLRPVSEITE